MTDFEGSLLRVLLPVIIGGLVVFGATTFYTDFWKKPDLHVFYHRNYTPSQRDTLEFRNVGQSHADNLRITITPDPNVNNFTVGSHSHNITLKPEGNTWIIESRKFPVGASVYVSPILMNVSASDTYLFTIAADQGVKEGEIPVSLNNTEPLIEESNVFQVVLSAIAPTIAASAGAILVLVLYRNHKLKEAYKLMILDNYHKTINYYHISINNMLLLYHNGNKSKEETREELFKIRNRLLEELHKGEMKENDYLTLDNRIVEFIEKMKYDNVE